METWAYILIGVGALIGSIGSCLCCAIMFDSSILSDMLLQHEAPNRFSENRYQNAPFQKSCTKTEATSFRKSCTKTEEADKDVSKSLETIQSTNSNIIDERNTLSNRSGCDIENNPLYSQTTF